MRHNNKKKILGRERPARIALMKSLADSLVLHGSIKTTVAKAKVLRTYIEPLVTKAKTGTLASRRLVLNKMHTEKAVKKLFDDVAPKYKDRAGGYTRIVKVGHRVGDAGETAVIEFV